MKPDAVGTKEMVYCIVRNLTRYTKRRAELEIKREQILNNVVEAKEYDNESYGQLLEIERELSRFVPIEMTAIDAAYNMKNMEEALEALKAYKSLLE